MTCLITGATSGIGKATALSLARDGLKLLLVSRSKEKGESVLEEIRVKTGNNTAEFFLADLSSQHSVRDLAAAVSSKHPVIDILINNAGGVFGERIMTVDGLELTFALDHLSFFLLTSLLLDALKAAPAARIINTSSEAHKFGTIDFDDLNSEKKYSAMKAYADAKLANLLFTYELARRLGGTTISVSAHHPGGVRTNFGRDLPGVAGIFFRRFAFLLRSPEKGSETLIWLATAPDAEGRNGKYFLDKKEIRSSKLSYDEKVAGHLWEMSAALTHVQVEHARLRPAKTL